MPITALNIHKTVDYIAQIDKDVEQSIATVWQLSAMDSFIEAEAQNKSTSFDLSGIDPENLDKPLDAKVDIFSGAFEAVRFCLKGFKRFYDCDGNEIEFRTLHKTLGGRSYQVVHPDILRMIPTSIVMELYTQINKISRLTEQEIKN